MHIYIKLAHAHGTKTRVRFCFQIKRPSAPTASATKVEKDDDAEEDSVFSSQTTSLHADVSAQMVLLAPQQSLLTQKTPSVSIISPLQKKLHDGKTREVNEPSSH